MSFFFSMLAILSYTNIFLHYLHIIHIHVLNMFMSIVYIYVCVCEIIIFGDNVSLSQLWANQPCEIVRGMLEYPFLVWDCPQYIKISVSPCP